MFLFSWMGEKAFERIRKFFFLGIAIISLVLMATTLVVPYVEYEIFIGKREELVPMAGLTLLQDQQALKDGIAYIGLAIFVIIMCMLAISLLILGKTILSMFYSEYKMAKNTKTLVALSTVLTCFYYLSSIVVSAVLQINKGRV